MFSDFDSMAIHETKQKFEDQPLLSPWVHLANFIIDVSNMLAYPRDFPFGIIAFKVVRTDGNDRSRSRLSSRKPLDMATAQIPAFSTFFAKETAEFGWKWWEECNGMELPTARQVFAGLEACYEMEL